MSGLILPQRGRIRQAAAGGGGAPSIVSVTLVDTLFTTTEDNLFSGISIGTAPTGSQQRDIIILSAVDGTNNPNIQQLSLTLASASPDYVGIRADGAHEIVLCVHLYSDVASGTTADFQDSNVRISSARHYVISVIWDNAHTYDALNIDFANDITETSDQLQVIMTLSQAEMVAVAVGISSAAAADGGTLSLNTITGVTNTASSAMTENNCNSIAAYGTVTSDPTFTMTLNTSGANGVLLGLLYGSGGR